MNKAVPLELLWFWEYNYNNNKLSSAYSIGLDVSCLHLSKEISWGEVELILEVNLQQSIVVTNIILCTCVEQIAHWHNSWFKSYISDSFNICSNVYTPKICIIELWDSSLFHQISYPTPAASPTHDGRVLYAPVVESLAEGTHSYAEVAKPDCHWDNLQTKTKKWGGL